ncbi:MAG: metallophosphoesterase, partial [Lachnospiraceae bacterium]|nr:metallophosphoesterase [Lachnospiraceae bacterium]
MIISCGDLPPQYLSFLVTFAHGPVLYVHGNHDSCYLKTPPEGCICIDNRVYEYKGIRIAGLGGCMEYTVGPFQFTEKAMSRRVRKLMPAIFFHRGIDIFVTHAPAYGLGDGEDLPHRGFQCFHKILDKYHPKFFIHG